MTPLQLKVSQALDAAIRAQLIEGGYPPELRSINTDRLSQIVYDTIRDAIGESLRIVAEARHAQEQQVPA